MTAQWETTLGAAFGINLRQVVHSWSCDHALDTCPSTHSHVHVTVTVTGPTLVTATPLAIRPHHLSRDHTIVKCEALRGITRQAHTGVGVTQPLSAAMYPLGMVAKQPLQFVRTLARIRDELEATQYSMAA